MGLGAAGQLVGSWQEAAQCVDGAPLVERILGNRREHADRDPQCGQLAVGYDAQCLACQQSIDDLG
jgi:hypothetical protein